MSAAEGKAKRAGVAVPTANGFKAIAPLISVKTMCTLVN